MNGDPGNPGDDGRSPWFTGPGLKLTVTGTTINAGVATVSFTITDNNDVPLDRQGIWTEGAVSASFVLAWLDDDAGEAKQYTAYTTNAASQASSDSGGTFAEVGQGQGTYTYTFGTSITVADGTKTHTVGVYATRDFEDARYVANATYDFLPAGGTVTVTRDVVTTAACNKCHNPLSLHGGRRREIKLCIMCHQPQSVDPESGNTVDMPTMIHKIHRGASLPSVQAGEPYQIIGFGGSVHDYSNVHFPRPLQTCDGCHDGSQGDRWKTTPTKAACTACHDRTSFVDPPPAGWTLHAGGAQPDTTCVVCHPASGGLAGVTDVHLISLLDPSIPKLAVTFDSVTNTAPGEFPTVSFTVTSDGAPMTDVHTTPLNRLRFTVAGPTTDVTNYYTVSAQGSGAVGTVTAVDPANGKYSYTMLTPIPPGATGSYGIAIEARNVEGHYAFNDVTYVPVTDTTAVPRRSVVDAAKCNNCHYELAFHGGSRKNPEYCAFCHNPTNTNDERIARLEDSTVFAPSVDFKRMIHKIHRGAELEQPYVLYGNTNLVTNPAGNPVDFTQIHYPGDLRDCASCHTGNSFNLPLASTVLPSRVETLTCTEDPSADGDNYCNTRSSTEAFIPPTTSVCTSCHDGIATVGHAEINTTAGGVETCVTCHGPGSAFDPAKYHKKDP